jgi:hypothetical protein
VAIGVYALLFWLYYMVPLRAQGEGWLQDLFLRLGWLSLKGSLYCHPVVLGGALLLTLGGTIVRSLASTRLQEGRADPLDGVRAWADRHPRLRKLPVVATGAIFAKWLSEGLQRLPRRGQAADARGRNACGGPSIASRARCAGRGGGDAVGLRASTATCGHPWRMKLERAFSPAPTLAQRSG